jgi:hypothetical protein
MRYGFYLPTRGPTATRDGRGSQRCARANGGNGIGSGSAPHYNLFITFNANSSITPTNGPQTNYERG